MKPNRNGLGRIRGAALWGVLAAVFAVTACSGVERENEYPTQDRSRGPGGIYKSKEPDQGSLFGPGGLNLFGGDKKIEEGGGGIGVNSFLWRASLDTFSFMPLNSADPFGGVIITDWHSPPETPDQRFKLTVYILTRDLRADGIRVAVFRQEKDGGGAWRDAAVDPATVTQLENAVLTRARELRIASNAN
ncbi:MAG: DUF3576 domain-containing protein [Alphaproteobacteria bacterium]|nr:DUF3576 domain-containing protein [Alphaproteobacteria bacterium]